eukprot:CAMPEP_0117759554 /NCGR_PEP_ID=MMETSP0947-20121206/16084_1 /TAXON_ID=44440 /ORGANISM="Chattonella subsalsa, Strain CCMP2191" /LENGTH=364 /DNA_ID=CAMNT_0005580037 /DNA_START=172 /DNA_END=1266 /DNA_ORIENTATION=-
MCVAPWNQHIPQYCGACYAHAALSQANDRIKILMRGNGYSGPDVILARQSYLNCGAAHNLSGGCSAGHVNDVFEFMKRFGLPDETCLPYNATDHTKYPEGAFCPPEGYCMNCMYLDDVAKVPECFPVTRMVRYRAAEWGTYFWQDHDTMEEVMMNEIYEHGPITCLLDASAPFMYEYTAGTFRPKSNKPDGFNGNATIDHAVELYGWGVDENGVKFWNGRNSWGTYWGMNGLFQIERGINALRIEEECHWMKPNISEVEEVLGTDPLFGGGLHGIRPNQSPMRQRVFDFSSVSVKRADVSNSHNHGLVGYFMVLLLGLAIGLVASKANKKTGKDYQKTYAASSSLQQKISFSKQKKTEYETVDI